MHQQGAGPDVAKLPDQPGARGHARRARNISQPDDRAHRPAEPPSRQRRGAERHGRLHDGHEAQQGRKLRVVRAGSGHEGERPGAKHGDGKD